MKPKPKAPGVILKFPRMPLPKQTGGVHKVKTKVKLRDEKYKNVKGNDNDDDGA